MALLVWVTAVGSTISILVGYRTRWAGPICFASSWFSGALTYSFHKVDPTTNLLLLQLFFLAFTPWGARWSLDARRGTRAGNDELPGINASADWAWSTGALVIALPYASGGLLKAMAWFGPGPTFIRNFLERIAHVKMAYVGDFPGWLEHLIQAAIDTPGVAWVMGHATPFFELGVLLALLSPGFRLIGMALVVTFQSSVSLLGGIAFHGPVMAALVILVPCAAIRLREAGGRFARGFPQMPLPADISSPAALPMLGVMAGTGAAILGLGMLNYMPLPPIGSIDLIPGLDFGNIFFATPVLFAALTLGGSVALLVATLALLARVLTAARGPTPGAGTLLYDRDCGLCQRFVAWSGRHCRGGVIDARPCQSADDLRAHHQIAPLDCLQRAYFVPHQGGEKMSGAAAIHATLARLDGPRAARWRIISLSYHIAGLRQLQNLGYWIVARLRHLSPVDECGVESNPPGR